MCTHIWLYQDEFQRRIIICQISNFSKELNAMSRYKYTTIIPLLVIVGLVFSCKKKSNDNPLSNVRIKTIDIVHSSTMYHYHIAYDSHNNVDSINIIGGGLDTGNNNYKKFNYFGSSFTITDASNSTYTVQANTDGLILKVMLPDTLSMIYNGSELGELDKKSAITTYPYFTKSSYNYTWANSDITLMTFSGGKDTYSYDQGKSGQAGDGWRIDEFLSYGRSYTKTSHLLTADSLNGVWYLKYLYQFDNNGRISQMLKIQNNHNAAPDDSVVYSYQYN